MMWIILQTTVNNIESPTITISPLTTIPSKNNIPRNNAMGAHMIALIQNIIGWLSLKSDTNPAKCPSEMRSSISVTQLFSNSISLNGFSAISGTGKEQNFKKSSI